MTSSLFLTADWLFALRNDFYDFVDFPTFCLIGKSSYPINGISVIIKNQRSKRSPAGFHHAGPSYINQSTCYFA